MLKVGLTGGIGSGKSEVSKFFHKWGAFILDARCSNGYIVDGFPRNLQQVKNLNELLIKLDHTIDIAIYLKADENELIKRLIKRSKDSGRSDDKIEIISKRQKVYREQTSPIIQYYKIAGILIEIDGIGTIEEITKSIIAAIK